MKRYPILHCTSTRENVIAIIAYFDNLTDETKDAFLSLRSASVEQAVKASEAYERYAKHYDSKP